MNIGMLVRYLFGHRQAILTIAHCPSALWIGLVFVLSAGFAREYDGEDLIAEPWHLLIPIGASLLTSFVLYLLLFFRVWIANLDPPRFGDGYRSFLSLYWMTAPLAWLYAIPYERFLSAPDSVRANLWTLGLVAAWRVALMIRVAIVLMGYRLLEAITLVLLFADVVAQTILRMTPLPIFSIMGGIRLSESDRIIRDVACFVQFWGFIALPVLGIMSLFVFATAKPKWSSCRATELSTSSNRRIWVLAIASLAVWAFVLPFTQPEQRLRRKTEVALRNGRIDEGIQLMLAHVEKDYPPHWDPPPRVGYYDQSPPLLDVAEKLADAPPSWVRQKYADKLHLDISSLDRVYEVGGSDLLRRLRMKRAFGIEKVLDKYEVEIMVRSINANKDLTDAEREEALGILKTLTRNE